MSEAGQGGALSVAAILLMALFTAGLWAASAFARPNLQLRALGTAVFFTAMLLVLIRDAFKRRSR